MNDRVKFTHYREHGGLSPDNKNPALIEGLEQLIATLGKRHDSDPAPRLSNSACSAHGGVAHLA